ncbi:MAG: Cof-type HAD-IIB family hydrolase [Peptoniphilaceae bacterium]|nr:Cof-type HAD-IIB family hydrolase [Peptoniphilaceae bacterium]MDY4196853.1 Cof-type HAD-IIB family hydrolase [Peptoniphilaceae bacterium]
MTIQIRGLEIQCIASDIDFTLINREGVLLPNTKAQLLSFQENGGKIALISGRLVGGVISYAKELMLSRYGGVIVGGNGAQIYDVSQNRYLEDQKMEKEECARLVATLKEWPGDIAFYSQDNLLVSPECRSDFSVFAERNHLHFCKLELDRVDFSKIHKVLFAMRGKTVEKELPSLRKTFSTLNITRSGPAVLEITDGTRTKGDGLRAAAQFQGIAVENTMAFGDAENDLPMFAAAGLSVAMKNAAPDIQRVCDFVTMDTHQDDGIGNFLSAYQK